MKKYLRKNKIYQISIDETRYSDPEGGPSLLKDDYNSKSAHACAYGLDDDLKRLQGYKEEISSYSVTFRVDGIEIFDEKRKKYVLLEDDQKYRNKDGIVDLLSYSFNTAGTPGIEYEAMCNRFDEVKDPEQVEKFERALQSWREYNERQADQYDNDRFRGHPLA